MRNQSDLWWTAGVVDHADPGLDPYLDAAARCFERYGFTRTTVPDVARELGVSRSTVYRRVGSIRRLGRQLLAREVRRALPELGRALTLPGPESLVEIVATVVTFAHEHGVLRKLARDEPEFVGSVLVSEYPRVLAAVVPLLAPPIRRAMRRGVIAKRDPAVLAEWIVRLTVSLALTPPLSDVRATLRDILLPVLSAD